MGENGHGERTNRDCDYIRISEKERSVAGTRFTRCGQTMDVCADVRSDWEVGSRITWSGEFKGTKFEDKGEILQFDPPNTLSYSHFSPMSGKPDTPENYDTVSFRLSESDGTTRVTLTQDNNPDEKARSESEKNWNAMLEALKTYVEGKS